LGKTAPSKHKPNNQHRTLLAAYSFQFAVIRAMLETQVLSTDKVSMVHVMAASI
jgi:hypothetical protein